MHNPHKHQLVNSPIRALPLFAQTLLACRIIRRAILAKFSGEDLENLLTACDQLESISVDGNISIQNLNEIHERFTTRKRNTDQALMAAFESIVQAQRVVVNPIAVVNSDTVTLLVTQSLEAVLSQSHFSRTQIAIIIESDIKQLSVVCAEAKIDYDAGLTEYITARLTPCHAYSLVEPARYLEDEYR